mmetsp:Transcript_45613/g.138613  ORF Transcript_45613/g.138613 Transcript_45613/m.138613 type:complete len:222 (+) Transcript_45613:1006-1671(+)
MRLLRRRQRHMLFTMVLTFPATSDISKFLITSDIDTTSSAKVLMVVNISLHTSPLDVSTSKALTPTFVTVNRLASLQEATHLETSCKSSSMSRICESSLFIDFFTLLSILSSIISGRDAIPRSIAVVIATEWLTHWSESFFRSVASAVAFLTRSPSTRSLIVFRADASGRPLETALRVDLISFAKSTIFVALDIVSEQRAEASRAAVWQSRPARLASPASK